MVNPYIAGFIILIILLILVNRISGGIRELLEGADSRLSLSKFQFFLWFIVLLYSYIVVYIARYQAGDVSPIQEIPPNLLIVSGASAGTMLLAKGITSSYVQSGTISKTPAEKSNLSNLVNDDENYSNLSKIQLLSWTLVAIGIYLISILPQSVKSNGGLIDIDSTLMVLMGLSQGTYLGKKLVTTTMPILNAVAPSEGKIGDEVILTGANLGSSQNGNVVVFGSITLMSSLEWSPNSIKIAVPQSLTPAATTISVIINGVASNKIPFRVKS